MTYNLKPSRHSQFSIDSPVAVVTQFEVGDLLVVHKPLDCPGVREIPWDPVRPYSEQNGVEPARVRRSLTLATVKTSKQALLVKRGREKSANAPDALNLGIPKGGGPFPCRAGALCDTTIES